MIVIDPRRTETAELADFHLAGAARHRRLVLAALGAVLVEEGLLDRRVAGRARHRASTRSTARARRGRRSPRTARSPASTRTLVRGAARRIAGGRERGRVRGPRRADEPALHAVSYLEKLLWLLTGNFAKPGAQYVPIGLVNIVAREPAELRPRRVAAQPGRRRPHHLAASCRATSSPRRSSPTTPTATGRCSSRAATRPTRSPTASACARRSSALDAPRRDRRGHDRDGPPRRLRAAGAVAVREVGGDVLQLRVPAQRLPPPPPGARRRPTGTLAEPEIHARLVEALGAAHRRRPRAAAGRRRARAAPRSPTRSSRPLAAKPELGALRAGRAVPHARPDAARRRGRGRRPVGRGPPLRAAEPRRRRRAGFGDGPRGRRAAVRRHPRQPVGRRVHRRRA